MSIQKGVVPNAFQTAILERAIGAKGVQDLFEQYRNVRKNRIYAREPSQKDIRIANVAKKMGFSSAARELGITVPEVYSAFGRTAKWNFYQAKD